MSNLKVGDRVRCTSKQLANGKKIDVGYIGTITHIGQGGSIAVDNKLGYGGTPVCSPDNFVVIQEEPKQMFNIKTDPWFIRVNSEQEFDVIQNWLEENYGTCLMVEYGSWMEYLTNTDSGGTVAKARVMHGNGDPVSTTPRKEIKLTFKTTVDSVQYPVVETEQQIKMKQLQETIDKAARELKELREMGENK